MLCFTRLVEYLEIIGICDVRACICSFGFIIKKNVNGTYPCWQDQNEETYQREPKLKDLSIDQCDQTFTQY